MQDMGEEECYEFFTQKGGTLLQDEIQAYAYGIEALNLLLDNEIKTEAKRDRVLDTDSILKKMNLSDIFRTPINMTLRLARSYFCDNEENGIFPNQYSRDVLAVIISDGQKPYQFENGRPVPIQIPSVPASNS